VGRFLLLIGVLGLCLIVPAASVGAGGTATDLALIPLEIDRTDGLNSTDDIVIGQTVEFHWGIQTVSGDPAPYTIHVTWPANPERAVSAYSGGLPNGGAFDSACTYTFENGSVTLSCPVGAWQQFNLGLRAHSPRELSVTATLSSSTPDPDESNNTYSWAANVVCSITGTSGDDLLVGTDGAVDSICGGDGNDHLVASGDEDDWLFGQAGDDVFTGEGHGSAYAVGGPGFDTVSYEDADQSIILCRDKSGYTSNLNGIPPNALIDIDRFIGSKYGDRMFGTPGDDYLVGRGGADRLVGVGGNDRLYGEGGSDRFITRDKRRDVIRGGVGRDLVRADRGDKVFSAARTTENPFSDICAG
jgi:Ca2+-binding RTX toxin-like protein